MKQIALVSLQCETGEVIRYLRGPNNKPEETGRGKFAAYNRDCKDKEVWARVWKQLQAFRIGYIRPDHIPPSPTPPLRAAA